MAWAALGRKADQTLTPTEAAAAHDGDAVNALSKKRGEIATQPNRHRMSRSSMPRFLPRMGRS